MTTRELTKRALVAYTLTKRIGILLPNNQRQYRTLQIQGDGLLNALWCLLCPVFIASSYGGVRVASIQPSTLLLFFFITLGLEMSDTKVYEP